MPVVRDMYGRYLGGKPFPPASSVYVVEPVKNGREKERPYVQEDPHAYCPPADGVKPGVVTPPGVEEGTEHFYLGEKVPRTMTHGGE